MNSLVITFITAPLGNNGVLAALITSLFVNTLKEIFHPKSSGDYLISSISSEVDYLLNRVDKFNFFKQVIKIKLFTSLVGLIIGIAVGYSNLGLLAPAQFSLWSLTFALAAILTSLWFTPLDKLSNNWVGLVIFLLSSSLWVGFCSFANLPHPILLFCFCVFIIPSSLGTYNNSPPETNNVSINAQPRWAFLPFCLLGSSAGINFNLFNSLFNPPGLAFVNHLAFSIFIEHVAIGRLVSGASASGTSAAGSVLSNASLPLACLAIFFAYFATIFILQPYLNFNNPSNIVLFNLLGVAISISIVSWLAGLYSLLLIPIGLTLSPFISKVPLQFKGLLFLGVVL